MEESSSTISPLPLWDCITPCVESTALRPGTDTALRLVSIPMLLNGLILYGFYILLQKNAWRQLVITLACGALLSILLNLWWIPRDGFVGAAHTSIVVHLVLALALVPQAQSILPARLPLGWLPRWGVFTVLGAATLLVLQPFLTSSIATIAGLALAVLLLGAGGWALGLHRLLATMPAPGPGQSSPSI